ncbi:SIS domain-containing protein [Planctomycetota bacterium]
MEIKYARTVLRTEIAAIKSLIPLINKDFKKAVRLVLACKGRVVVTGMGKTGLVGQKISATLASTGTPSLFLHSAEAYHGDLGRVVKEDLVLTLSNSGETDEVTRLLPAIKKIGTKIISITRSRKSPLGKYSDLVLEIGRITEACPLGLVPSASTTAMLALGDALALTVFRNRGFNKERFAFYHPGGELGRRMLKVHELMRTGKRNPVISQDKKVKDALNAITRSRAGAISIINAKKQLVGVFTDGDLRRHLAKNAHILHEPIKKVMTAHPSTAQPEQLAAEVLYLLREKKIDEMPVVDRKHRPIGMLDVQDLLDAGLV